MMLSCLSLPFRLLGIALLAAGLYLAWHNRDDVRRLVHRMTADGPAPVETPVTPELSRSRMAARLDSLSGGKADSVIFPAADVRVLVADELAARAPDLVDSVSVELGDGTVAVRGLVDTSRLPKGILGSIGNLIDGRQPVEVNGALSLLRIGMGELRIENVRVRGVPVPRSVWESLVGTVMPGSRSSLTFPVDTWITGVRVTPGGTVLYGKGGSR